MSVTTLHILIKLAIYWVLFLVLHFAYDWMKNPVTMVISGVNESFLQHAKIGFISYSMASVVEFFLWGQQLENPVPFIYSRLLASVIMPWVMFIIWYIAPALMGKPMPTVPAEIVYANITLLIIGGVLMLFENNLAGVLFTRENRIMLWALWGLSFLEMAIFTFRPPWADFFHDLSEWGEK